MIKVTLPPEPAPRPAVWDEMTCEVETADEVMVFIRFFALRDHSTRRWDLMDAWLDCVTLRLGGRKVVAPVGLIDSRCDKAAILAEAERHFDRIEEMFERQWESVQGGEN